MAATATVPVRGNFRTHVTVLSRSAAIASAGVRLSVCHIVYCMIFLYQNAEKMAKDIIKLCLVLVPRQFLIHNV